MSKCKIISVREDHILVYKDGTVQTKINDSYNKLKYGKYDGNRIFYKFEDGILVQETYDDRIFNCQYSGMKIQIRKADELCNVITCRDKTGFIELFKDCYYEDHREELLNDMVRDSFGSRVIMRKRASNDVHDKDYNPLDISSGDKIIVIDDRFMVDQHATAHFLKQWSKEKTQLSNHNWRGSKKSRWEHLCIVVQGGLRSKGIKTDIGIIKLDSKILEILAKINYLLHPNVKDTVFMGQLPDWLSKMLIAEHKAGVSRCPV